jgi:thioredoxin 1
MADTITESTFQQQVLESEQPVLVDFWAEWCGPCHAVAPILDQIAEERADQLRLVKVNIDEEPELAQRYGIMSIPTMILFEGRPAEGGRARGSAEGHAREVVGSYRDRRP